MHIIYVCNKLCADCNDMTAELPYVLQLFIIRFHIHVKKKKIFAQNSCKTLPPIAFAMLVISRI